MADVIDLARTFDAPASASVNHLAFDTIDDVRVLPIEQNETAYYLRIQVQDRKGVLASIATILSNADINIEALIQKEPKENEEVVQVILLTHTIQEKIMNDAIAAIKALEETQDGVTRIRVEQLV